MTGTRKPHPEAFKARVALEAAKQTRTLAELPGWYQVLPSRLSEPFASVLAPDPFFS